jgi:hypothetical protein
MQDAVLITLRKLQPFSEKYRSQKKRKEVAISSLYVTFFFTFLAAFFVSLTPFFTTVLVALAPFFATFLVPLRPFFPSFAPSSPAFLTDSSVLSFTFFRKPNTHHTISVFNKPKIIYVKPEKAIFQLLDEAFSILFSALGCAVLFVFLCFALVAEVRLRPTGAPLVDLQGILRAVLTPMPSVRCGSLNILYHSYPPKIVPMSPLIFFIFPN